MANTENIEAKLCAYVDGELDSAGRAEIETHLATNPQHRQLMEELMAQRDLLRDLPRERAPEDLFEAMTNQLERSVLLDGEAQHAHVAGRINRWPQVFAAAAVLLLAIGLAAVIYAVLPDESQRYSVNTGSTPATATPRTDGAATDATPPMLAMKEAATAPTATGRDVLAARVEADRIEAKGDPAAAPPGGGNAAASPPVAVAAAPTVPEASLTPSAGVAAIPPAEPGADVFANMGPGRAKMPGDAAVISNIFADAQLNQKLKQAPGVPDESVVVVVNAGNLSEANQQIQEYFAANNIRWEPVVEPMPQPLDLRDNQMVLSSRLGQTHARLKGGFDAGAYSGGMTGAGGGAQTLDPQQQPQARREIAAADAAKQMDKSEQQRQHFTEERNAVATATPALPSAPPAAAAPQQPAVESHDAMAKAGNKDEVARRATKADAAGDVTAPPAGKSAKSGPLETPTEVSVNGALERTGERRGGEEQELAMRLEQSPAPGDSSLQRQQRQAEGPFKLGTQQNAETDQDAAPPLAEQSIQQQQHWPEQPEGQLPQSQMFIARGLTREQVAGLNSAVAYNNRVSNFSRAGDTITPTTLPTASTAELSLNGTVPVIVPGSATQPMTQQGYVQQAQRRRLQDGSHFDRSSETAEPAAPPTDAATQPAATAAPAPATAPADEEAAAPATGPTEALDALAGVPATQPAPGEERVDVVILVQGEALAGAQAPVAEPAPNGFETHASPATKPSTLPVEATTAPASAPAP